QNKCIEKQQAVGKRQRLPVMNKGMLCRVPGAFALANEINAGQPQKQCGHRNNGDHHGDAVAAQAVFAGNKIIRTAMIAIITAAISTPMRNLSRPASTQLGLLRLLFNLDMLNGGGHNCLDEVYYRFVTEFCIRKSDFSPGTLYS